MRLSPGMQVDRYIVESLLGTGGFAEVWQVRHVLLGTRYALKILTHKNMALHARLLEEGRAQNQLTHPNLLPVREILDLSDQPALLMPLIEGPSLAELLKVTRPPADASLALIRGIAAGLGHAHAHGFVHRDLKPGNVLLDWQHERIVPRIADFGIARRQRDPSDLFWTRSGIFLGTPAYAAPEQLRDTASVDARADLFALGVIMVELFTGHRPFVKNDTPDTPNLDGLPEPLRPLVTRMLAAQPAARPPDCAAVLRALPSAQPGVLETGPLMALFKRFVDEKTVLPPSIISRTVNPPAPEASPHNLPAARDAFFGRHHDIDTLRAALGSGQRLITLTGPGGAGKTRLAIETGRTQLGAWPGGVWFVDLVEATDVARIQEAVARSLGVQLQSDPTQILQTALQARGQILLILDNFEQIIDHASKTVGTWLDVASELSVMVTSRSPLHLRGEMLFPISELSLEDAIALFVDRVAHAKRGFALTEDNAAEIAAIVEMLDRLPLALELAAARSRMLPPSTLLARLSKRFAVLTSRSQELSRRHRTLRATIQWSWDLLSAHERAVLAQCAVFEGGFTMEAVEAVVSLPPGAWVEDILAELVDKSLLRCQTSDAGVRLSMLVSIQAFAAEQLSAEARQIAEHRHRTFFASFGRKHTRDQAYQRRARLEMDNLLIASHRAATAQDSDAAMDALLGTYTILSLEGPLRTLEARLRDIVRLPTLPSDLAMRLQLWRGLGWCCIRRMNLTEAQQWFEIALAAAQDGGTPTQLAEVHLQLAQVRYRLLDHDAARRHYDQAIRFLEDAGEPLKLASVLVYAAGQDRLTGRMARSQARLHEALPILEAHDDQNFPVALKMLGSNHTQLGQAALAEGYYRRAEVLLRAKNRRIALSNLYGQFGYVAFLQGRFSEAIAQYRQAIEMERDLGTCLLTNDLLVYIGHAHEELEQHDDAVGAYRAALSSSRTLKMVCTQAAARAGLAQVAAKRGQTAQAAQHMTAAWDLLTDQNSQAYRILALQGDTQRFLALQRDDAALEAMQTTLQLLSDLDERQGVASLLLHIASLHLYHHRIDEAAQAMERSEALWATIENDHPDRATLAFVQARIHHARGEASAARRALVAGEAIAAASPRPQDALSRALVRAEILGEAWPAPPTSWRPHGLPARQLLRL